MKTCAKCGCIHFDKAVSCRGCGIQFPGIDPDVKARSKIYFQQRIFYLAVAWGAAALAMTIGAPSSWLLLWFFPIYSPVTILLSFVFGPFGDNGGTNFVIGIGWFYYVSLTIGFLVSQARWIFVILCLSLLINVGGCLAITNGGLKINCQQKGSNQHSEIQPLSPTVAS